MLTVLLLVLLFITIGIVEITIVIVVINGGRNSSYLTNKDKEVFLLNFMNILYLSHTQLPYKHQ